MKGWYKWLPQSISCAINLYIHICFRLTYFCLTVRTGHLTDANTNQKKKSKEKAKLAQSWEVKQIVKFIVVFFFLEDLGFCHFLVQLVQKCLRLHIYKSWSNLNCWTPSEGLFPRLGMRSSFISAPFLWRPWFWLLKILMKTGGFFSINIPVQYLPALAL